jgi:hypothetical protein
MAWWSPPPDSWELDGGGIRRLAEGSATEKGTEAVAQLADRAGYSWQTRAEA